MSATIHKLEHPRASTRSDVASVPAARPTLHALPPAPPHMPASPVVAPVVLIERFAAIVDYGHRMSRSHLDQALAHLRRAAEATGDVARDDLAKAAGHCILANRCLDEAADAVDRLRRLPGREG